MNDTYRLTVPCESPAEPSDTPCHVAEMTHFGERGTGFLWCDEHAGLAGTVDVYSMTAGGES